MAPLRNLTTDEAEGGFEVASEQVCDASAKTFGEIKATLDAAVDAFVAEHEVVSAYVITWELEQQRYQGFVMKQPNPKLAAN